jgi:putative hemolysin
MFIGFSLFLVLVGLFCLTATRCAWRTLPLSQASKIMIDLGYSFFYLPLHRFFFPLHEIESLFFANICAQSLFRFIYVILSFLITIQLQDPSNELLIKWPQTTAVLFFFFLLFFVFSDYLPRLVGLRYPLIAIRFGGISASFFMLLSFPFIFVCLKISQLFSKPLYFNDFLEPSKQEIIEMIQGANMNPNLDPHDKKLFESVVRFRDRITREVMVPRVDLFSLPANMSIQESSEIILIEGYSRIPIYQESNDNMVGVLMYKDIIAKYMEYVQKNNDLTLLQAPISSLMKSVLYTPETKKISQLLQEFRKKQVHLAVVVDEYGGTEGIITIEDILEEIVGDIEDEYDEVTTTLTLLPAGGWLIDARANIFDLEDELEVTIPHTGDYDTIGGYIFHQTGMIPPPGFILKDRNFEIEVLSSDDRKVGKIRFTKKEEDRNVS